MKICVLMEEIPFPPRRNGLTLRYYSLINTLNKRCHEIDVKIYGDQYGQSSDTGICALEELGINIQILPRNVAVRPGLLEKIIARTHALLPWGKPLSEIHYGLEQEIELFRETQDFSSCDIILIVGAKLLEIYNALPAKQKSTKCIIDFVDSPSLHKYRVYKESNPFQLLKYYDYVKSRIWEQGVRKECDAVIYISQRDANFVKGGGDNIIVVPNGIEYSELTNALILKLREHSLGFVGDMSYQPNIKGVLWFLDEIWLSHNEKFPQSCFYIVGQNPPEDILLAEKRHKNVVVTGYVDNIWSYYKSIRFFVCPLFSGAGLQNKVIEAMFAARPVLATSIANSGVQAIDGRSILLANNKNEFLEKLSILEDDIQYRKDIGAQARKFAEEKFDWDSIVNELEEVIGFL